MHRIAHELARQGSGHLRQAAGCTEWHALAHRRCGRAGAREPCSSLRGAITPGAQPSHTVSSGIAARCGSSAAGRRLPRWSMRPAPSQRWRSPIGAGVRSGRHGDEQLVSPRSRSAFPRSAGLDCHLSVDGQTWQQPHSQERRWDTRLEALLVGARRCGIAGDDADDGAVRVSKATVGVVGVWSGGCGGGAISVGEAKQRRRPPEGASAGCGAPADRSQAQPAAPLAHRAPPPTRVPRALAGRRRRGALRLWP